MPSQNSTPFWHRTWIRLILVLMGIVVLTFSVTPLLKHLLENRVKEKLVGNFSYEYKNLTVDLPTRSVTFDKVKWKFPKDSTIHSQEGTIKKLRISGISILSVLLGIDYRIKNILLDSLDVVNYITLVTTGDSIRRRVVKLDTFNFYQLIKGQIKSLTVKEIQIKNGNAIWLNPNTKQVWRRIHSVQFNANTITIDSVIAATSNGWFTVNDAKFEGKNAELFLADSLHKIHLANIKIDYGESQITIDSLVMIPLFSQAQMTHMPIEIDRIEFTCPLVIMSGVEMKRLLVRNEVRVKSISANDFRLAVFRDKNPPSPDYFSHLPQMAFKQAAINVSIDTLKMRRGTIAYKQLSDLTQKEGGILFSDMSIDLLNITNDSLVSALNGLTKLKLITHLMGKSKLSVDFEFDLNRSNGHHWFKGSLDRFDLTELNKVFIPFNAISIRSGQLDHLTFSVRLNNDVSEGELSFLYSNLKIDKLDKDDLKNRDFDNSFKSLMANTFLIKKSNPSGKSDPRIGVIHYKRAKEKSIFNFWLKSILDGMKYTVFSMEPAARS